MVKTKKTKLTSVIRKHGLSGLVVVVAFAVLGSIVLPDVFAATGVMGTVTATASNNSSYAVTVRWTGVTSSHWKGQTVGNGTTVNWTSASKSVTFNGLRCNVLYTFKVAAAGPSNGTQSAWGSAIAKPPCPTVAWNSFGASGNTVTMSWHGVASFPSTYNLTINGKATTTSATSWTINGSCNTTYSAYISATSGGQPGPVSATQSATTAACPKPPATPTPTPPATPTTPTAPTPAPKSGGSSSSTSSGSSTKKKTTTGTAAPTNTPTAAPEAPTNFATDVVSHKIVELNWEAASGADHYVVNRSTDDGQTWQQIVNTEGLSYSDSDTVFNKMYTYQLQAVGADGQTSSFATAQAMTEEFEASSNRVTSDDKLVVIDVPDGAIDGEYSCTPSTNSESASHVPADQSALLGPYSLRCVGADGEVINSFNKPLKVTMKLAKVSSGYDDISAQVYQKNAWTRAKGVYNAKNQQLVFSISKDTPFAAFGVKHRSPVGLILFIFFALLLIVGAVVGFLWWRRRNGSDYYPVDLAPMVPAVPAVQHPAPSLSQAAQQQLSAEQEFRQALSQPDCSHVAMAQQVIPSSAGCYECEQQGTKWKSLRICLICGHVGCSDDSPQQHAFKHYQETGHPVIYEYGNPAGNNIGWCYIDQTYI